MQSLERMRARTADLQELGQVLDHSPRKYTLHSTTSRWDYRTPPSNRKARIVDDEAAADLADRLRRVRSNTTISSRHNINRELSTRSKRGTSSALGFREAEVREDMELAGLGAAVDNPPFRYRVERSRERQRFSKKSSVEKWKGVATAGVGWLKGRDSGEGVGKEEKGREKEEWL